MATLFVRICHVGAAYMMTLIVHFCSEITHADTRRNRIIKVAYLNCLIITAMSFTDWLVSARPIFQFKFYASPGPLYPVVMAHILILMAYSMYLLVSGLSRAKGNERNQISYIIFALSMGYPGGLMSFLPVFSIPIDPFALHFLWLYTAIISYAILKHQLLDIKIVIQKTILYSFLTLLISSAYAVIIFAIQFFALKGIDPGSFTNQTFIPLYKWSGLLALVMNVGLAGFVYYKDNKNAINRNFFILSVCIGGWAVGSWLVNIIPDKTIALGVLKINYAFGCFVPVLFLAFIQTIARSKRNILVTIGYALSAIFALSLTTDYFVSGLNVIEGYDFLISKPGPVYYGFVCYFCLYFAIAFGLLLRSIRSMDEGLRRQMFYVFAAYLVGMVAGLEYFSSVFGILKRPPLDDYILVATFLILSYAIVKHGLMDIRVVLKKTLSYSVMAFVISAVYVVMIFLLQRVFYGANLPHTYFLNSVVVILLITLLLRPIEALLRKIIDKKFFKGTIEEISEQKERLEVELERRERLKSVGILAAGMAHEIKNPLTAINTFAEYLPEKYDDPVFREKFSRIVKQEIARVKDIVSELLLFSKPSEPKREECDIAEVVKEIMELLSSELLRNKVEVVQKLDAHRAYVDPDQIKQALLNIIMNAIDAMKDNGGKLTISTFTEDGRLKAVIEDTGCGIPEDKIKHIFDPFFTAKEHGTGLGLAITHSIIEKNAGRITVESTIGVGTCFKIDLPVGNAVC